MHLDKILKRTAPCQVGDEEEEDAANNAADVSEYDAALIGAACDLVGTLSSTLGSDFAQIFPTFAGSMASYAVGFLPRHPPSRATVGLTLSLRFRNRNLNDQLRIDLPPLAP